MSVVPRKRVILFGDSLIESGAATWIAALSAKLGRRCDFVNRGLSGYNSTCGLGALRAMLAIPSELSLWGDADLVVIWFGCNDACPEGIPNYQHVDLPLFRQNLLDIMATITEAACHPPLFLLVTPPPVVDALWHARPGATSETRSNRKNELTRRYAQAAVAVAEEADVAVLNTMVEMAEGSVAAQKHMGEAYSNLFSDGVHFSVQGADLIAEFFLEKLSEFGIDCNLQMDLPCANTFDPRLPPPPLSLP